jgi:predicted nucleic acid-binding protein
MKRNPDAIKQLTAAKSLLILMEVLPIQIIPVDITLLTAAQQIVSAHGLLANDALTVSAMQRHGIVHLATNDNDFDHVSSIAVWKPR